MSKPKKVKSEIATPIEGITEPHPNNLRGVPLNRAYPEKAAEWYYKKNCGFGPEDFHTAQRSLPGGNAQLVIFMTCEFSTEP